MYRNKIAQLIVWKDKNHRKPLILNGARQVGKSWLVRELGEQYFGGNFISINFERSPEYHKVFDPNLDPKRICAELSLLAGKNIQVGHTLLFLDEIQACPKALMSLRYFYEELPTLHLIAAGSLLDFSFRNVPYPVGRVEFEQLHPMTFSEFLLARQKEGLSTALANPEPISEAIEEAIYHELQHYFVVGGMPECVSLFCETNDFRKVAEVQRDLIYTFRQDFKKYKPAVNPDCLTDILDNSVQLIGSQTQYSKLSDRFTNPTIKQGHQVLCMARLLHKIENVSVAGLPLTVSGKQFKTYFLDIGLMLSLSKLNYATDYINRTLLGSYEGRLAEQFVAQQLIAADIPLHYWARTEAGANAEIDFVMVENGQIVPIEVKAGKKGGLRSLHFLLEKNPHIQRGLIFGKFREGTEPKLHFLPIYKCV
jgi:uncharacterized protein